MTVEQAREVEKDPFMGTPDPVTGNVENVGTHAVGTVVSFCPDMRTTFKVPALVVRNYGTADGKVLYELALELSAETDEEVQQFFTTRPIKAVDSMYVRF